jgi:hypothetical protein
MMSSDSDDFDDIYQVLCDFHVDSKYIKGGNYLFN